MKGDHIGEFEELVLLAIRGLGDEAYALTIKQRLDAASTRDVSIGAVYAAVDRLEAKGLLESHETAGTATRGGRRRRAFAVTREGQATLREMHAVRERLLKPAPARSR